MLSYSVKTPSTSPTEIRSILYGNVANILDKVAKMRTHKPNEDALFGGDEDDRIRIELDSKVPRFSELEILLQEKNSLGLYVSGAPLAKYHALLNWVRDAADREDIHLLLIDKIKKIFTRSNTMMLALQITSADEVVYEGIVFPKNAPRVSPLLEEKQIYWVKGRVIEGRKKKVESASEEEGGFEELPKIAIEDVSPFTNGITSLFQNEEVKMSINRQKALADVPWQTLLAHPEKLDRYIDGDTILPDGGPAGATEIKIPSGTPTELLKRIKSMLVTTPSEGLEQVELYLEKSNEWKKVKGVYYTNLTKLQKLLDTPSSH